MSSPEPTTITVTNRTVVRIVILVILSLLALELIRNVTSALSLVLIALFLSLALNSPVSWLVKRLPSKSRSMAVALTYTIVLLVLLLFLAIVGPTVVHQTIDFVHNLSANIQDYNTQNSYLVNFVQSNHLENQFTTLISGLKDQLGSIATAAVSTAGRLGHILIAILTVLVMSFMMLIEGPDWLRRLAKLQNPQKLPKRLKVLQRMYGVITNYFNGQIVIALMRGLFTLVVLLLASTMFGLSINVVVYAFIIAIGGLVPMLGAIFGSLIVVILCLFSSLPLAIIMALFFIIYQQVERTTIQPVIQTNHHELTPLVVFIALLIGIGFGGLLGAIIAIPIVGCLRAFMMEYYGEQLLVKRKDVL